MFAKPGAADGEQNGSERADVAQQAHDSNTTQGSCYLHDPQKPQLIWVCFTEFLGESSKQSKQNEDKGCWLDSVWHMTTVQLGPHQRQYLVRCENNC